MLFYFGTNILKLDSFFLLYHIVRTRIAKVTASFSLFKLSKLVRAKKSTLPYTLFLTYLPQAYSPLEHSRLTVGQKKFFTPCSLSPFFTERVGPYLQVQLYWAGRTVRWMAD